MSAPAADNMAALPATVKVVFPRTDSGVPSATPYVVTLSLDDLVLEDYQRASGVYIEGFSGTKVFKASATATYTGGGSPTNVTELTALATQIATDFYNWQMARLETVLIGYPEWVLTGLEEEVEFVHGLDADTDEGRLWTRFRRGPWLDHVEDLHYHGTSGVGGVAISVPVTYSNSTYYTSSVYYYSFTSGSIPFLGTSGLVTQDNANFYFDDTNNQLLLGLGSASFPSHAFVGDPNTGIYSTAADQVAISVGGALNFLVASGTTTIGPGHGGTPATTTVRGPAATGSNITGASLYYDASNGTGTGGSGAMIFRTAPAAASSSTANTLAEAGRFTPNGTLQLTAGTTTRPPLNLPHGTAPTSPTDGDVWTTSTSMYARVNGVTVDIGSGSSSGYTTEEAQDAAGALCTDGTLTYTDATPLLSVTGLKESGGQALTMATIADGDILWRTGTTIDGLARDTDGTLAANSDTSIATQKAVKTYVDAADNIGTSATALTGVPRWIAVTKTFADFSAAATSNDIEIFSLPAGAVVHACIYIHTTAFTGGALAAYTVSIGKAGSTSNWGSARNVFAAVTDAASMTISTTQAMLIPDYDTVVSIRAYAGSFGANLNAATAGSMRIMLLLSDPKT